MALFKGLVYVKHGEVGTKSEGPEYHLQTVNGDFILYYSNRLPWELDYHLEFYSRRMVEITGSLTGTEHIQVEQIKEICEPHIPDS